MLGPLLSSGPRHLSAGPRPAWLHAVLSLPALAVLVLWSLLLAACGSPPGEGAAEAAAQERAGEESAGVTGPRVVVLGTVQDGGLPHAGCTCDRCQAARRDPARRRRVASLGVVLPAAGKLFLVDATPDVGDQLYALRPYRPGAPAGGVDREPVDGVLLTHAHIGHYLGLAHFGYEVLHTRELPVYCTPAMARFLAGNGPWDQLVRLGNVELRPTVPGTAVELGEGVTATALAVPHRDEYSDTVAYLLRGPRHALLYVPDTQSWQSWQRPLPALLEEEGIDVALLDGTFYSLDELPGRDLSQIGHPLITQSLELLEPLVRTGRVQVRFTHLNHSNPALEPGSEARRAIEARGFTVLAEGAELAL